MMENADTCHHLQSNVVMILPGIGIENVLENGYRNQIGSVIKKESVISDSGIREFNKSSELTYNSFPIIFPKIFPFPSENKPTFFVILGCINLYVFFWSISQSMMEGCCSDLSPTRGSFRYGSKPTSSLTSSLHILFPSQLQHDQVP